MGRAEIKKLIIPAQVLLHGDLDRKHAGTSN